MSGEDETQPFEKEQETYFRTGKVLPSCGGVGQDVGKYFPYNSHALYPSLPPSRPSFLLTCVGYKTRVDEAVVVVHALRKVDLVQHGRGLLNNHLVS